MMYSLSAARVESGKLVDCMSVECDGKRFRDDLVSVTPLSDGV